MGSRIKMDGLEDAVIDILNDYGHTAEKLIDEIGKEVIKESTERLIATSPKDIRPISRRGAYANDWKFKKDKDKWVAYNKKNYRLTHLLEFGHRGANGARTSKAYPHIEQVQKFASDEFIKRINERLGD